MIGRYLKTILLASILVGLLYAEVAFVVGVTGAGLTYRTSSSANLSGGSGALFDAQAGNVTELDISGKVATTHWAGFYGNISGNMTLEDSSGNVFYDWTGLGATIVGEVFATNQSSVVWSGIGCANGSEFVGINSFLGLTGTDSDRLEMTYTTNAHDQFDVAGVTLNANQCNTTNAYSNNQSNSSLFTQVLLTDDVGVPVFTTLINDSSTGFNGNPYDFQLLAGVKPTGSPLYFYIELG